jgi:shikimate kinase
MVNNYTQLQLPLLFILGASGAGKARVGKWLKEDLKFLQPPQKRPKVSVTGIFSSMG